MITKTPHQPVTREDMLNLYREAVLEGIPLEEVQRRIEAVHSQVQMQVQQEKKVKRSKKWTKRKLIPLIMITFGSLLMANALWPILSYLVFTSPYLQRHELLAPIPEDRILAYTATARSDSQQVEAMVNPVANTNPKPVILAEELDYSNLANWFYNAKSIDVSETEVQEEYLLDVPSLNIHNAKIQIGGTDLNESLIQYPGTADPGSLGAPVIFGHSVLPQFYRPEESNPRRYNSIFTKLSALKNGDQIFITHQGVKYTYTVAEKHEVQPDDTFILQQRLDQRELKLVTCTPAGTYLRRLVVTARLDNVAN